MTVRETNYDPICVAGYRVRCGERSTNGKVQCITINQIFKALRDKFPKDREYIDILEEITVKDLDAHYKDKEISPPVSYAVKRLLGDRGRWLSSEHIFVCAADVTGDESYLVTNKKKEV